jgi:hypothetical protein
MFFLSNLYRTYDTSQDTDDDANRRVGKRLTGMKLIVILIYYTVMHDTIDSSSG